MILLLALLLSPLSFSASDSVAVFHRPEKVVILINERGRNGRLQQFMNAWQAETDYLWENADKSIRIDCGRNETASTCTFRLLPSEEVKILAKESIAKTSWAGEGPTPPDVAFSFESSMANYFEFSSVNGALTLITRKR